MKCPTYFLKKKKKNNFKLLSAKTFTKHTSGYIHISIYEFMVPKGDCSSENSMLILQHSAFLQDSSNKNICCGYSLEVPHCLTEALLMSTHNICFYAEIRKIIK